MTLYEVLLFFHIIAMALWVGGGIMTFISTKAEGSDEAALRARFGKRSGVIGGVIGASAVTVLGTGIGMVLDSDTVELSQTWVWLGLALLGISFLIGAAFYGPQGKKIVAALEAGRADETTRRVKQWDGVVWVDSLLLVVIVGVMVFKPEAPV